MLARKETQLKTTADARGTEEEALPVSRGAHPLTAAELVERVAAEALARAPEVKVDVGNRHREGVQIINHVVQHITINNQSPAPAGGSKRKKKRRPPWQVWAVVAGAALAVLLVALALAWPGRMHAAAEALAPVVQHVRK
jgi:hypothetical protein